MKLGHSLRGVVFDAYGTLFDVYSIGTLAESIFPGRGSRMVQCWREAQIDYTRIRTLSDRYAPFSQVTRDALRYACARCECPLDGTKEDRLMGAYDRLQAFTDARTTLSDLRALGLRCAILSNGDPPMLATVVGAAGLDGLLDHVLSVDAVRRFKTAPQAYALAPAAMACSARELLFVSGNGWDACGAGWYGYRTIWINRHRLPLDELGVRPDREGRTLSDVVRFAKEFSCGTDPDAVRTPPQAGEHSERATRDSGQELTPPSLS